jgi:hypothetical protein
MRKQVKTEKKLYCQPKLTVYGTVRDLTQRFGASGMFDGRIVLGHRFLTHA